MNPKSKAASKAREPDIHLDSSNFDAMMGRALAVPPKGGEKVPKKRSASASQPEGDRSK